MPDGSSTTTGESRHFSSLLSAGLSVILVSQLEIGMK